MKLSYRVPLMGPGDAVWWTNLKSKSFSPGPKRGTYSGTIELFAPWRKGKLCGVGYAAESLTVHRGVFKLFFVRTPLSHLSGEFSNSFFVSTPLNHLSGEFSNCFWATHLCSLHLGVIFQRSFNTLFWATPLCSLILGVIFLRSFHTLFWATPLCSLHLGVIF